MYPSTPASVIRHASPLVVRSTLTGRLALAQMADDFRTLVVTAGGVVADDLLVIGWTQRQIDELGSKARTKALAASVR